MRAKSRLELVRGSLRALWSHKFLGGYFSPIHAERLLWAGLDPHEPETLDQAREVVWEEGLQQLFINNTKTVTDYEQARRDWLAWEMLEHENPARFNLSKKGSECGKPKDYETWRSKFINNLTPK